MDVGFADNAVAVADKKFDKPFFGGEELIGGRVFSQFSRKNAKNVQKRAIFG